jgi:hypothetical protein
MIGMGSNLVAGIFLAVLLILIAIPAAGALLCGIWLWRKKRLLALAFLIPSVFYLALFFFVFAPRPLPRYEVHLDLRSGRGMSSLCAIPCCIRDGIKRLRRDDCKL